MIDLVKKYKNKKDMNSIKKLLTEPMDFLYINKMLSSINKKNDYNNIKSINKHDIIDIINSHRYKFDNKLYENLKKLDHGELKERLFDIFKKITINKDPSINDFPNILTSCSTPQPYCDKNKFMIDYKTLDGMLDIMASDILNPIKSKYLINPIMVKNNINKYIFEQIFKRTYFETASVYFSFFITTSF